MDLPWRRSSFCGTGACVDVARDGDKIVVRDGKFRDVSITQRWTVDEWTSVLDAVKQGKDHQDIRKVDDGGVWFGRVQGYDWDLYFNNEEWAAFTEGVLLFEFDPDRLSTPAPDPARQVPEEAVPVGTGSGLAATGAGAGASGVSVPVAAQPRYILDAPAILDMVGRYAAACVEAATTGSPKGREDAREQIGDLWDAIRAALTPVPNVEPEPAWGSGPLVDHNPSASGTP